MRRYAQRLPTYYRDLGVSSLPGYRSTSPTDHTPLHHLQVRSVNEDGKAFTACVDGDEAFVESFKVAEEGKEWVRLAPDESATPFRDQIKVVDQSADDSKR